MKTTPTMRIISRFGIAGLVFFTLKGIAWLIVIGAGAAGLWSM